MTRRTALAVLTGALWLAACSGDDGDATPDEPGPVLVESTPATEWVPVWADEFEGTSVDTSAWSVYHNTYGDGNGELACLTPDNVTVVDGTLRIEARAEQRQCPNGDVRSYTSGFLGSREVDRLHPLYGRYEIRARVPHGQGVWPAFWLRHAAGAGVAEVDVLEVFHSQFPGQVTQTLHFPESAGSNAYSESVPLEEPTALGDWHEYAVEITPDEATGGVRFVFFVDGVETGSHVDADPVWRDRADPQRTWDLAVNLAVGGRWVGEPERDLGWFPLLERCSLTGETTSDPASCPSDGLRLATLPAVYEIDHVRVSVPATETTP